MTAESRSVADDLTPDGRKRRRTPSGAGPEAGGWLTSILRPAGPLDPRALRRLGDTLGALAASSDMVIVDLTAADGGSPREIARSLRGPARQFELAGHCLMLVGASAGLTAELDRTGVPVITLAADVLPLPAAWLQYN
jgi:hypothetical protein